MTVFALATLTPALLLALAAALGGAWCWAALAAMTLLVLALDRLAPAAPAAPGPEGGGWLPPLLGAVQLALLPLVIGALARGGAEGLGGAGAWGALFAAFGLWLGQVGNANAHELIHAAPRWRRRLGLVLYASVLWPQHVSAHLLVHHVHVATPRDPASAPAGMGFWRYAGRAWAGSFRAGWRAEARRGRARAWRVFALYAVLNAAALAAAAALAGPAGLAVLLGLAAHAQLQLLLSDYVQHYGLRRARTGGRTEPVGPAHAWNAPHWYSGAMMLQAPRHSDHHQRPARPFTGLELRRGEMPELPHALPVMAVIALAPPLWRRVMDPRLARWSGR